MDCRRAMLIELFQFDRKPTSSSPALRSSHPPPTHWTPTPPPSNIPNNLGLVLSGLDTDLILNYKLQLFVSRCAQSVKRKGCGTSSLFGSVRIRAELGGETIRSQLVAKKPEDQIPANQNNSRRSACMLVKMHSGCNL